MGAPRIVMTSFGYNDAGGGTTVPRLVSKELVRRGWDVTVFHAAVHLTGTQVPYELREWEEDGVRLIGVHNRPHGLFDHEHPLRELNDPAITAAFAATLDRLRPDVIHFHNLHNLGARLMDEAAVRGVPAYFSTHNYWLICPRAYLMTGNGTICAGPGDGSRCADCTHSADHGANRRRLSEIRSRAHSSLTRILAVSDAVRASLLNAGYDPELVEVLRQAMPHESRIWDQVGATRRPGRADPTALSVAFLGSAYPHKGPQLLVEAAQRANVEVRVKILGEAPERFEQQLRALDRRGTVEITGSFEPSEIGRLLADVDAAALPSMWWDCAPLAAAECRAARLPLIVPRLGGLDEAIIDGADGLNFTALDAGDLARQLDRLASEPGLLARLQQNITAPPTFAAYVDELERRYAGDAVARPASSAPNRMVASGRSGSHEPAVRWQGDFGQPTSLSIINDRVSAALAMTVQRVSRDGVANTGPLPHPADIEIRHQWPPDLSPARAGALAAIVPWEFGSVPTRWLEQIQRNVDELWVPSDYVAGMYRDGGIDPARIQVIPNGVDLETFHPVLAKAGAAAPQAADNHHTRFLFVGGVIPRKGPDVLLRAWVEAFPGRDDVTLVIKDFGADGIYRGTDRSPIRAHADSGALPRIEYHDHTLSPEELADLYRSADVLVAPYRGEGFAMPVLEAMACGLAVIATGGGPSDEFCPPDAGWRIASSRRHYDPSLLGAELAPEADPWMLEPDADDLIRLLRDAAADPQACADKGAAGRRAAEQFSWERVAERYAARIRALASTRPLPTRIAAITPMQLDEDVTLRLLATPAWHGRDRLDQLLARWAQITTPTSSACLYLLADPDVAGGAAELEAHVVAAAARGGANLERCGDINLLMSPHDPDRDARLHAAMTAYVPLHRGCAGHLRLAQRHHNRVYESLADLQAERVPAQRGQQQAAGLSG